MKKIIINVSLSVFFIHLHAQNELPYRSLSDFKNDTTAFVNYNFIDRVEQYKGKTMLRNIPFPVPEYEPVRYENGQWIHEIRQ